jgi:HEAT repeat protein
MFDKKAYQREYMRGKRRSRWDVFRKAPAPDLEKMEEEKDIDGLIYALTLDDYFIIIKAIDALGRLKDTRAIEPLLSISNSPDFHLFVRDALISIGEPTLEYLIAALSDKEAFTRIAACQALEKIQDKRAKDALIRALKDEDFSVGYHAVIALGNLKEEDAVIPILDRLKYTLTMPNMSVEYDALLKIGDKSITELINVLDDGQLTGENYYLIQNASTFLMSIGEPAVLPLIQTLPSRNPWMRLRIAEILGFIGDKRAIGPLQKQLAYEYAHWKEFPLGHIIYVTIEDSIRSCQKRNR